MEKILLTIAALFVGIGSIIIFITSVLLTLSYLLLTRHNYSDQEDVINDRIKRLTESQK